MTQKILLLGGAGMIGTALTQALLEADHTVIVPTRRKISLGLAPEHTARVAFHQADIHDEKTLEKLMTGVDIVINLVGILHGTYQATGYSERFAKAHVELPRKIVACMQKTGVRRLLHISALGASEDAPSGYLRSKADAEKIVLNPNHGLQATVFRPSIVIGPRGFLRDMASAMKRLPLFPLFGPPSRCQPIWVGDLCAAMIAAFHQPSCYGQYYEMVGEKVYSVTDLIRLIGAAIEVTPRFIRIPFAIAACLAPILYLLPNPPLSPDLLRMARLDNVATGAHAFPDVSPHAIEPYIAAYLQEEDVRTL